MFISGTHPALESTLVGYSFDLLIINARMDAFRRLLGEEDGKLNYSQGVLHRSNVDSVVVALVDSSDLPAGLMTVNARTHNAARDEATLHMILDPASRREAWVLA